MEKIVLSHDPFWNHIEEMNGGGFKCRFCGQSFTPTTSISRIKWSFSGEKGHGVAICGRVSKQVQEAAFEAMCGGNKQHKGTAGSSNANHIAVSTCPQEGNNEVESFGGDTGRVGQRVGGERTSLSEAGNHQEKMMHIDRNISLERHVFDAREIRQDVLQATDQVSQVDLENTDWEAIERIAQSLGVDAENGTGGFVPPVDGASSSAPPPFNIKHQINGDGLPNGSTKLVGEAFEKNKNVIRSCLMNDEVSLIGIYGMGGVG